MKEWMFLVFFFIVISLYVMLLIITSFIWIPTYFLFGIPDIKHLFMAEDDYE